MFSNFRLFPEAASKIATDVDALYFFLIAISLFFTILIAGLIVGFSIKYRRQEQSQYPQQVKASMLLEITWVVIPLLITLIIFIWGANLFSQETHPPEGSLDVYVLGKQWMWEFQHTEGPSEINELHVPVNQAVRLTMASKDVIHSFYVPAFRIKADLKPGVYSTTWFEANKTGTFPLRCAEYCGTKHAGMGGQIVVMQPVDYQNWLSGNGAQVPLANTGEKIFLQYSCNSCHRADGHGQGPALENLYGSKVKLLTGEIVTADETYLRESIVNPQAKIVAGFQPVMPTFQGVISEENLIQLIEYLKGLKKGSPSP